LTKKNWGGEVVTEALGLKPVALEAWKPELKELVGIAFRENPKRAHLLVSKVLGKHYPQSPTIIKNAASILAYQIYEHYLAGVGDSDPDISDVFRELRYSLKHQDDKESRQYLDARLRLADYGYLDGLVVFGYAETATALGASIADTIGADYYINSTRYPDENSVEYGGFEEEHSHATSHHLTPRDSAYLDDDKTTLVLVDDELTTGRTILNTIAMMQEKAKRKTYYIATLVDLRDEHARTEMEEFAASNGIDIKVFSLYSGHLEVPANAIELAAPEIARIKDAVAEKEYVLSRKATVLRSKFTIAAPNARNGFTDFIDLNEVADTLTRRLGKTLTGSTLILGIEEDMYLPLQVAYKLEAEKGLDVSYSTTTRSPVLAYDHDGYAIRDRIKYSVPEVEGDTSKRFSYNIGDQFNNIVIIAGGKSDADKLTTGADSLINALSTRTRNIFIMEPAIDTSKLAEPLVGPEFGSYAPEDVKWLLRDLSNVELEGSIEDREKAVQSGKHHYAESLPKEYQPSDEYQQLFLDVLESTKHELALSVGIMADQIYRRRNGHPVLVSLARAGVPIGVLTKRFLKRAYGIDSDHLALSIVRDRGIDFNALNYIAANYDVNDVILLDGWSGKGRITRELNDALDVYEKATGIHFPRDLAVVADPASSTDLYGTREDIFIPSAALNSTVSGLISRTVLNKNYIGENDYHGGKFYSELTERDYSNFFIDTVDELFTEELIEQVTTFVNGHVPVAPNWGGWASIVKIAEQYGIDNIDRIKPGGPETLRILLRRVPEKILIRPDQYDNLKQIVLLAKERGAPIELVEDLPYAVIGLIKKVSD
jgi:adenine/guanine phosphoribosyltransferase-like PRPP-binding protein